MKTTKTHDMVKDSYARMIKGAQQQSAAGTSSPVASLAENYGTPAHGEAADASFGCGNPLAFSGVKPGDTVLDLGSGAGLDLLIAAEKVGPSGRVIGIDMTEEMIAAARRNADGSQHDNIHLQLGMIEDLPLDDASVDWVISNCVINLSPQKDRVFSEMYRVLKPGGQFSISDIVLDTLPDALRKSAAAWSACIAGAITEQEYIQGLRDAGLVDVAVTERLVYDAGQLRAILAEEIPGLDLKGIDITGLLEKHPGVAWSAKFTGRKETA